VNLRYFDAPITYVLIDDYFADSEVAQIWSELHVLSKHLRPGSETESAKFPDGTIKKKNSGIFLPDVYKNLMVSPIFSFNRKIFSREIVEEIVSFDRVFGYLPITNSDNTLVQFYQNGDYYKPHHDTCLYTLIVAFYKTPKLYGGGVLKFDDYEVDLKHNQAVFFPSYLQHEVTEIQSTSDDLMDNRISISTLIGLRGS
jgi:Rps23 Pro-64 3,4-dihydroxylase Tpa1-like proline 4-hydroxylase